MKNYFKKIFFKLKFTKNTIIIVSILVFLIFGIIFGSVLANKLGPEKIFKLTNYLDELTISYKNDNFSRLDIFKESLLKYSKVIVIIWMLSFLFCGFFVNFFIIFLKGMSYGFTTSIVVIKYGMKGLYLACGMYLLQNIFLLPVYMFVAFYSIKFSFENSSKKLKIVPEYFITLMIGIICVVIASFIEAYAVPNFLKHIIT